MNASATELVDCAASNTINTRASYLVKARMVDECGAGQNSCFTDSESLSFEVGMFGSVSEENEWYSTVIRRK